MRLQIPTWKQDTIASLLKVIIGAEKIRKDSPFTLLNKLQPLKIVFLIDGWGFNQWKTDKPKVRKKGELNSIHSVFPSTTSVAIPSIMYGQSPLQHGITGFRFFFEKTGCVTNSLTIGPEFGYDHYDREGLDLTQYVSGDPVFAKTSEKTAVYSPSELHKTALSHILYRNTSLHDYRTLSDLFFHLSSEIHANRGKNKTIYVYYHHVDTIAHLFGKESDQYQREVKVIDTFLHELIMDFPDVSIVVTADHGHESINPKKTIDLHDHPDLLSLLAIPPTGQSRSTYLHARPGAEQKIKKYVAKELPKLMILSTEEALKKGVWGPGKNRFRNRIGDFILLPGKETVIAYEYNAPKDEHEHTLLSNHGGLSENEMLVPLFVRS